MAELMQQAREIFPALYGMSDWQTAAALLSPFVALSVAAWYFLDRR
jgi:hypothetical protein